MRSAPLVSFQCSISLCDPLRRRRFGRGEQHEPLRSVQRGLDRAPQVRVRRQAGFVAEHVQRPSPIPGLGESLEAGLQRGCEPTVGRMAVRHEGIEPRRDHAMTSLPGTEPTQRCTPSTLSRHGRRAGAGEVLVPTLVPARASRRALDLPRDHGWRRVRARASSASPSSTATRASATSSTRRSSSSSCPLPEGEPLPISLEIARFLAPLVSSYAAVIGLAALFRDRIQQMRIPLMRDHVIVCGLGFIGSALPAPTPARSTPGSWSSSRTGPIPGSSPAGAVASRSSSATHSLPARCAPPAS